MDKGYVAFILESVYGHIVPTLGIAAELVRRGYRVDYAVKKQFEARIASIGAQARVYEPLENKFKIFREMEKTGSTGASAVDSELQVLWKKLRQEETDDTLAQLKRLYESDQPDLIVYDCMSPAGRVLAGELDVAAAEHSPMVIALDQSGWTYDEKLVLVSIPKFFQRGADELDNRFQFIGFIQNDRSKFFTPWKPQNPERGTILVVATTGLLPQIDFFKTAVAAFADSAWQLVLSIGDNINPTSLGPLPPNCEINRSGSTFEILKSCCLAMGQGGQGSSLEALYHGVPQILIPPSPIHEECARRVAELGLGVHLGASQVTAEILRETAASILADTGTHGRLQSVAKTMQENNGAALAADLLASRLSA